MGLYSTLFYYATMFAGSVLTALAAITAGEIGSNIDWKRYSTEIDIDGLERALDAERARDPEQMIILTEEEMTKMD